MTVLVIEPYAAALEALALVLADAGHRVLTAGDDSEALARYEPVAAMIDVVVDGSPARRSSIGELARRLRARSPRLRIVVIAGLGERPAEEAPTGVTELRIPIDVDALMASVVGAPLPR